MALHLLTLTPSKMVEYVLTFDNPNAYPLTTNNGGSFWKPLGGGGGVLIIIYKYGSPVTSGGEANGGAGGAGNGGGTAGAAGSNGRVIALQN